LGPAFRCAMVRSAGDIWSPHRLLQSLRWCAAGWRPGPPVEGLRHAPNKAPGGKGPCLTDAAHLTLSRRFRSCGWPLSDDPNVFHQPTRLSLRRWCHQNLLGSRICRQWRQGLMLLRLPRTVKPGRRGMLQHLLVARFRFSRGTAQFRLSRMTL
jgi:hypothetical protein